MALGHLTGTFFQIASKSPDPRLLAESDSRELLLIRSDKWIEEVQQDWRRLRKSSEAVRNDVELVLAAIQTSKGQAIKYAGTETWAALLDGQCGEVFSILLDDTTDKQLSFIHGFGGFCRGAYGLLAVFRDHLGSSAPSAGGDPFQSRSDGGGDGLWSESLPICHGCVARGSRVSAESLAAKWRVWKLQWTWLCFSICL